MNKNVKTFSKRKFFSILVVTGVLLVVGLVATNWFLNPLSFSASGQAEVAKVLNSKQSYAIYDPNFDFRGLRREHLKAMTAKPEVVIFAGSRFEVATANVMPDRTFYNAFVHNDYFEDMLAIVGLLEETDKLPKTLVMSIRHLSFVPIEKRESEEWKMFVPEYSRMAEKLGLPVASSELTSPVNHYKQLFSLELAKHRIEQAISTRTVPYGPTDKWTAKDMDVLHPDGSISFSEDHLKTFTPEAARAQSAKRAQKYLDKPGSPITKENLASLGRLVDYLKGKGVQVVIAFTPHHPVYWEHVSKTAYGENMAKIEDTIRNWAPANGAVMVGSFNPETVKCGEENFRDYIHVWHEKCLKSIFATIPRI